MNIVVSTLNAKYIHTSLALRCLKAYAAPEYDVDMAEYTIKDPVMNIVTDLYKRNPDVLGFSCYIWNIEETIIVVQMMKKIKPEIKIILGGPEVTYDIPYWLDRIPEADFIVIGEGEETFKQLLDELHGKGNFEKVSGLAFNKDGENVINPQRNKIDLREMPSPFRFEEDRAELSKRVVYIETSRGCPFSCQFCLSSIEVGVRYFDRDKVKDDIRYLMNNGARTIKFVDRTFNISRSYAMEMFQFLIDERLPGTVFQFEITADIMRPEVIQFLNDHAPAGLFRFEIGVQSTNDAVNELVKRKQNFKKLTRTVTMVKEGGKIDQHLDLIAGLPDEDYASFKNTFNDVFELRPEELQLGFLKMLRGTGLRLTAAQHDYQFMEQAPYEILSNKVLPFSDVVRIKQVEDILEKYWNDHRMDETIEYLVQHRYETPFDFFQLFGTYWDEQGWSRIGHQLEDLFKRLQEYLHTEQFDDIDIIEGFMKIDYLKGHKHKPRKPWWQDVIEKQIRSHYYQQMLQNPAVMGENFVQEELTEKELYKHTILEFLPFDYSHYKKTGKIVLKDSLLLTYYDPKTNEAKLYAQPLESFQLPVVS